MRNVFFVLLGVAALMLKRYYTGPFVEVILGYGGNISASFAVYFIFGILTSGWRYGTLVTAGMALLTVELFEAANGFGIMTNVYDPVDFAANVVGVGLALGLDALVLSRWQNKSR